MLESTAGKGPPTRRAPAGLLPVYLSTCSLRREGVQRAAQGVHLGGIRGAGGVRVDRRRDRLDGGLTLSAALPLGGLQGRAVGGDLGGGDAVRPLQLVEVGARQREGRRPDQL